jgi:hypothetical protein
MLDGEDDDVDDGVDLKGKSVKQLRAMCRSAGIKPHGKKQELVERLGTYYKELSASANGDS